jgi:hypothetical protein
MVPSKNKSTWFDVNYTATSWSNRDLVTWSMQNVDSIRLKQNILSLIMLWWKFFEEIKQEDMIINEIISTLLIDTCSHSSVHSETRSIFVV